MQDSLTSLAGLAGTTALHADSMCQGCLNCVQIHATLDSQADVLSSWYAGVALHCQRHSKHCEVHTPCHMSKGNGMARWLLWTLVLASCLCALLKKPAVSHVKSELL